MERLRPNSGALACLRKGIRTMTSPTPNTSRDRYMVLNAFTMATVSHLNYGLWRHPADQTHRYKDVDYWVDLAKLLDREGLTACSSQMPWDRSMFMATARLQH